MTALELRKANKALNQKLVRMEKTRGTANDLTKTRSYKSLQKLAKEQGVKSRATTGGYRFKERGLEKMSASQLGEIEKTTQKARAYKPAYRALKEQQRRMRKGGVDLTLDEINDFNEIFGSTAWNNLMEHYSSNETIEIFKEMKFKKSSISDKIDQYYAARAGMAFNPDEFKDFLAGYIDIVNIK